MRRLVILAGIMVGLAIGTGYMLADTPLGDTAAADNVSIRFSVGWYVSALDGEVSEGDTCSNHPDVLLQDRVASVSGFVRVVTVRDAAHDIVETIPLIGSVGQPPGDNEASMTCTLDVRLTVPASAGFTLWYEDAYLASIPEDGSLGDDPWIVLTD